MSSISYEDILKIKDKYKMDYNLPPKIFYDVNATKPVKIIRTWKERLFGLPWKPWEKFKEEREPCILSFYGYVIVHPSLRDNFEYQINKTYNII
jgi:hypothetical protein